MWLTKHYAALYCTVKTDNVCTWTTLQIKQQSFTALEAWSMNDTSPRFQETITGYLPTNKHSSVSQRPFPRRGTQCALPRGLVSTAVDKCPSLPSTKPLPFLQFDGRKNFRVLAWLFAGVHSIVNHENTVHVFRIRVLFTSGIIVPFWFAFHQRTE